MTRNTASETPDVTAMLKAPTMINIGVNLVLAAPHRCRGAVDQLGGFQHRCRSDEQDRPPLPRAQAELLAAILSRVGPILFWQRATELGR
jgi:hypothetical protein